MIRQKIKNIKFAIKNVKNVFKLKEENDELKKEMLLAINDYDKLYKKYKITYVSTKKRYEALKQIKEILSQNNNGSEINTINLIKTILKENKI